MVMVAATNGSASKNDPGLEFRMITDNGNVSFAWGRKIFQWRQQSNPSSKPFRAWRTGKPKKIVDP